MLAMRNAGRIILAGLAFSVGAPFAYGEGGSAQQLQEQAKQYSESMPTGSVPATNILGISDTAVPRVTNFKSIVSQLTQGIGPDGKIKNAFGFEVAPYLLANDTLDWKKYDDSALIQVLTRTTASLAAVTASDNKTATTAAGIQSVFYSTALKKARSRWESVCSKAIANAAAELGRIVGRVASEYPKAVKAEPGKTPTVDETQIPDCALLAEYQRVKKEFEEAPKECQSGLDKALQAWNSSVFAGGVGWGFYSPDSTVKTLTQTSSVSWLTAALGWGDGESNSAPAGLLTLHVRKASNERTPDPTNANNLLSERSTLYGANLRYGSRQVGLLLEGSARKGLVAGLPDENLRRWFVGMDAKVAEDLYLSWGVGGETGRRDGQNRKFALTNIKYAFGNTPVFRIQ